MSVGALSSGNSSIISGLLLKALDKDSSGAASLDEFKTVGKSLPGGKIDQSDDALAKAFASLDADSDGSVTEAEIAQGLAKFSSASAMALLGQQEVGGPPPPPPGGGQGAGFFTEADSDGSGTVSLDEFTAAGPKAIVSDDVESAFASIDADGDGEITATEDETFRAAQGGPGGPGGAGGPPPGPPPSGGAETSSSSTDDEDATTTLLQSLSDLLKAQSAYSASSGTSYLDDAISSLFGTAA